MTTRARSLSTLIVVLVGAILVFVGRPLHGQGVEPHVGFDAEKQLSEITTSLTNGRIATIDVLHSPDRMETRVSLNPDRLEKWFESRVTIKNVPGWAGRDELVRVMKSTGVRPGSQMPDLRSAIIFYGPDGRRVGAIYVARFFRGDGAIGNAPVSFRGDLADWLRQIIPSSLQ